MNRNDRAVTAFTMLGHATFHTYELAIPLFVVVWLDVFETSPAVLGGVVGLSFAAIGLGALPTGLLADRVSARGLVLASVLGMGSSMIVVAVTPSLGVLAIALVGWGIAASLYHPAALTLLSRATTARGRAFALHGLAGNVGVATGPIVAAVLLGVLDWRAVALVLVLPVAVAVIAAIGLKFDETAGTRERRGERAADGGAVHSLGDFLGHTRALFTGGFVIVFVLAILYGTYYRGSMTFLPEILAGLALFDPVSVAGQAIEPSRYVYAGLLLIGGAGQYAGGRLVEAMRTESALILGYAALVGIALVLLPLAAVGLIPLLAGAAALGFLVFMLPLINQEAISAYTAANVRGLSFGYNYMALFGVGAIGAPLAGIILTRWSPDALFVVLAIIALMGTALAATLWWRGN
ncbi:MAG: MFS transporter [Salinirussus sp.]